MTRCTYCNAPVPPSHFWRGACKRRLCFGVPIAAIALAALVWAVVGMVGCVGVPPRVITWVQCVRRADTHLPACAVVVEDLHAFRARAEGRATSGLDDSTGAGGGR